MRLTDEQFDELFDHVTVSAFRLESRATYHVEAEQGRLAQYRAGIVPRTRPDYPWRDYVAAETQAGKSFERVHVVRQPLSEYVKFQCEYSYRHTVAAGEDVRILDTSLVDNPGLPNEDFWLFDDETVVRLVFHPDDRFDKAVLISDRLDEYRAYRQAALAASTAFTTYWSRVCGPMT